ncbi:MAG: fibronectin type III domain-containing protein, partial [Clostridia bacterium]|nr:fibronectin type III domain-containing protein [Clostridia bacterium]
MKKAFKSLVILAFCLAIVVSTVSFSLAAPGSFELKASVTPTSVTLKWTESKDADKYVVYRKQGTNWKSVKELPADTKSYTIKKLKTGEKYTYRVKAVENVLIGSSTKNSNELTVTPGVSKVTSLKAAQYNYNTVKLTWKKLSGVTGYQIYQYNAKTKKWSKVKTVSSKYDYAHIKSLKNGSTYKFRVRAYYKSSKTYYGSYSSTASVKVGVPAATVKVTTSYNAVKLSWNKVPDATGYRIYKYDSAKKKWVTAVKSTKKTSYTFKDLTTGKSYSYRVRPYQTVSKKVYWGSYETTKATPTLAKPTGFKAQPSTYTTVKFKWDKVSGAHGYRVYRYNSKTEKWDTVLSSTKSTSFKDTKLEPQTQYSYKVKAFRKVSGKAVYSSASSAFKTSTEVLPSITEVNLIARTETSLTLLWNDIRADAYEIYTPSGVGVKRTNETQATIEGLNPGTTYKYKIKAYFNEDGKTVETHFTRNYTFATEEKATTPVLPTKPTEPSTKPTEPSSKPTEPSSKPTEPSSKPTEPSSKPTEPSSKPTEPSSKPTEPSSKPTEPSSKPTEPSSKPTEPSSKPTEPSSKPTEPSSKPTEPSSKPTEPSTKPTEPPTKPTEPSTKPTEPPTKPTEPSTKPTEPPTKPPVAPSKVTGLAKTAVSESSISVKWNAAENATNYMLSYTKKGSTEWTHLSTTSTSYVISGLASGTAYEIKVTAANDSTIGVASDVLTVSTTAKAPEAAKNLTATSVDANSIKLSWEALSGASTYDVQYYSSVDAEWQVLPGGNNLTERTFTDTPLKSGRQHCGYLYRVVGRNSLGDQIDVTKTVTGTTKGLTVTQDDYSATISWDSISNVKNYSLLTYVKNLGSVP